jgi:hypothetical protein
MVDRVAIRARGSSRLGVSALGVVGALFVHALLVLPFVLDLSSPSRKVPDRSGAGASALLSAAQPEMTVVFVNESPPVATTEPPKLEELASRGRESPDLPLVVLSPDDSPSEPAAEVAADRQQAPELPASAPASAQHALLYGRYLGQLQARIERAWLRPRTEIGAPQFYCRARVRQDHRGAVIEVTLDHCNGTERWQQSLLSAIRTASPLPAPPDASVYADILRLSFFSEAFEEGGSTQGFEPETRAVKDTGRGVLESFQQFVDRTNDSDKSRDKANVMHLTIIGNPADPADPSTPTRLPAESAPASPAPELQIR